MKKNYDEELVDLSKEVWGEQNLFMIEDPPSEDGVYENKIVVALCFPGFSGIAVNHINDFIDKCKSRYGKQSPQNKIVILKSGNIIMLSWVENLKEWRKRTKNVKQSSECDTEDSDGSDESSLSDIFDSLKTLADNTSTNDASFESEDDQWKYIVAVKKKEDKTQE